MLVLSRPPAITISSEDDLSKAQLVAKHADISDLAQRDSALWVGIDALPFLTSTEAGREFLAAAAPRALARGVPAASCPVATFASAPANTPKEVVASEALRSCLANLGSARPDCGCQIVALDNLVTVPRDETAYATGTSARMRSASLGIDLLLVAEDTGEGEILLRDLNGPVARLTHGEGDAVTLSFQSTGQQFDGRRIPVGFRRGRIAERIYATDADGNRLSLLIGFEPSELAGGAGAWLAWPTEG